MNMYRIRRLITGLGLTMPMTTTIAGCGDPCLDDGKGQFGASCDAVSAESSDSADDQGEPPAADEDSGGVEEPEPVPAELFYRDADQDGFGTPDDSVTADPSDPPPGYVPADAGVDCDDSNLNTHPGAAELEELVLCTNDDDDDGWGDVDPGPGISVGQDCDDLSDSTHPGAASNEDPAMCTKDDDGDGWGDSEPPPGVDPGDDCADQDPVLFGCHTAWCIDADGDGFGDPMSCIPGGDLPPSGDRVSNDDDCVDEDGGVYPGAAANEPRLCTIDSDGDGWGAAVAPVGADMGSDCLDTNSAAFPGAATSEPALCTIDADGDGWGDAAATVIDPLLDDGTDCVDDDAAICPGAAANEAALCTFDGDGDGFGASTPPAGAEGGTDCDDASAFAFPGASENETAPLDAECTLDADEDGFGDLGAGAAIVAGTDCNDGSANTFPGAAELEDLVACMSDEDLDGYGDSDPPLGVVAGMDCEDADITVTVCGQWCFDADSDGFGNPSNCELSAVDPGAPWVANDIDCLDSNIDAYPGAAELEPSLCTIDSDDDGFGTLSPPPGVDAGADCDDASDFTHPGASEAETAPLDAACTTDVDSDGYGDSTPAPGVTPGSDCVDTTAEIHVGVAINEPALCTADDDGDGYGASNASVTYPGAQDGSDCEDSLVLAFPGASENETGALLIACTLDADEDGFGDTNPPPGVTSATDCDDATSTTHPGAAENEDPIACMADADLDGYGDTAPPAGVLAGVDCEDNNAVVTICGQWCTDADGDGFGTAPCQYAGGSPGPTWVANEDDCVDTDAAVYPGAASGEPTLCTSDIDGDGYGNMNPPPGGDPGADCDDSSTLAQPGAAELDDLTACMIDADDDGYGDASAPAPVVPGSDCSDVSAEVFPGAASLEAALCTVDADGDGYGDDSASTFAAGAENGSDCNDLSPTTCPGAAQFEPSLCATDDDDDGYGDSTPLAGIDAGSDCADDLVDAYPGAAAFEPGLCTLDQDGDGFGDDNPPGGVGAGTDCDDQNSSTYPGTAPNEDVIGCFKDDDGDGYGDTSPPPGVTPGLDCDDTDPNFADCTCLAPLNYLACDGVAGNTVGVDVYEGMGLGCNADPTQSMVIDSSNFAVVDGGSWAVINQYGSAIDPTFGGGMWTPRPQVVNPDAQHNAGNNLVVLSTGPVALPNANGVVLEAPSSQEFGGDTLNLDFGGYPAPITEAIGSNNGLGGNPFSSCQAGLDCSDTLGPLDLVAQTGGLHDQVFFQVTFTVPAGVDGFRFDFAYFSSEYPQWVNTIFNDIFVVWVESSGFTGNVAVTPDGTPFTVTELANAGEMTLLSGDPLLAGTGYETNAGTGWRSVLAPVVPGESVTVSFFLADAADQFFSTSVLIDNFRWDCAGCDGVGDCGLTTLP